MLTTPASHGEIAQMKHAAGCTGNVRLQLLVDRPTPPPPASLWKRAWGHIRRRRRIGIGAQRCTRHPKLGQAPSGWSCPPGAGAAPEPDIPSPQKTPAPRSTKTARAKSLGSCGLLQAAAGSQVEDLQAAVFAFFQSKAALFLLRLLPLFFPFFPPGWAPGPPVQTS